MNAYRVTIITENDAFASPADEVARILRVLADKIESVGALQAEMGIRDINGNLVGTAEHLNSCLSAIDLAEDLAPNGKTISTSRGRKSAVGLADMIRRAIYAEDLI